MTMGFNALMQYGSHEVRKQVEHLGWNPDADYMNAFININIALHCIAIHCVAHSGADSELLL